MASPRVVALAAEAEKHPDLADIDRMLLELSYMERNPATSDLTNKLLDLRAEVTETRTLAMS